MNLRVAVALVLLGAVAAGVWAISRPAGPHVPPARPRNGTAAPPDVAGPRTQAFQAAAECQGCHASVFEEWKRSYHGMAWTDPMVRELSGGFSQTECIDCHAPLPIHVTGVTQRVAPRRTSREDGVDCLSCHLLEDGISVAATRTVDTSGTPGACRPVEIAAMSQVDACQGCHNQHETVDELAASGLDKTCADCHMETVPREGGRAGRSHVFPGGHDLAMHRRAAKLDAAVEGGDVVVRLANVGAGHKIPTDARHRSYNLWISAWDARGNPFEVDRKIPGGEARLYYRDDFRESTQVAHGKELVARWPIPQGLSGGRAKVRLTYALNPTELAAGKVMEVASMEVAIP